MEVSKHNIIKYTGTSISEKEFESLYITSRKLENRLYTDEQTEQLPSIDETHIHYKEWRIRSRSANRLISYLDRKNKPVSILEIGCGNGWLTNRLSGITRSSVTGADINKTELIQAIRVFGKHENISFKEGINDDKKYDAIIFAASIQYFPSFYKIIRHALSILNKNGEIHILDSHLYKPEDTEAARKRTIVHFKNLGVEEMASFYFHHSADSLGFFNYKVLFDPSTLINRIFRRNDPFPWIRITDK